MQRTEATFDALPFDAECARAYGRIYAAVISLGRKARGAQAVDLLIAATALAYRLPLYTRNLANFDSVRELVDVIEI